MFDLDRFIEDCCQANRQGGQPAVQEVVARAVRESGAVLRALGEPAGVGVQKLYHSPELTVTNVVWAPMMTIMPHDHRMWAVIGVYGGREDNVFWRRVEGDPRGRIEAAGAKALATRDCTPLGSEIIHSVTNPLPRLTGALQVYGGDFFGAARSEWDPESLHEVPYDVEKNLRLFHEFNARWAGA